MDSRYRCFTPYNFKIGCLNGFARYGTGVGYFVDGRERLAIKEGYTATQFAIGFEKLSKALKTYGFKQSISDYSLFDYEKDGVILHVMVYVDDLIIVGNKEVVVEQFKQYLSTCFHMKDLSVLKYFLGIEVARNKNGIYLRH